ncbi:hypothetical protein PNIG_a2066 [Pseudoalteromonas nigrifaciens]|uniref:DUF2254 domain-containing protein n=1 Tax=Pseudoalteromonas nigrifaciens TaxID=28109 RepID=A0AAC9UI87_9GAMM|nr:DUF2254 domain-containing protein [Pseudoalteromonas nigrifaciens]ASM54126.1 hypothetical protein PNIG_a2066 [Pseudoalteromonas nigrifaciens]GEN42561.1 hypothetical protein PNI02_20270 [Pseudoalteromonas nigrifaciens]SUC52041.1 Predicted membrane protein (DUF2254) [Pseudoalteromonas nigrifaciens]|tara:strand:- start:18 stop:1364 length:1347 start_codon:yes stop_codon:yes gene_type:complete
MFVPRKVADSYREMINSIGFYPSLLSIAFLTFAVITMSVEYMPIIEKLKSFISVVLVDSAENARTVLSTLAGSIISLTVFSFSMVMVVLNSASASLSPRVVPGLITRKSHQLVLGFYLGSIIYSVIMLININKLENGAMAIPALGVLFALIFGLISLGLFVFFIHSISRAIQVDNVLNGLFSQTKNEIKTIIKSQQEAPLKNLPDFTDWHSINSQTEGYYKGVHTDKLCALLSAEEIELYITVKQGYFTVKGYPFLKCNKDISSNDELIDKILSCFIFYIEEYISDHYRYGLTQISEIAVKAMSPGINDPGTAVKAIDMLSILLIKRLSISDINYSFKHSKDTPLLYIHETRFDELLHDNFTPLRNYAKGDAYVMTNVLEAFKNILFVAHENSAARESLFNYLNAIVDDINEHVTNEYDRQEINNMLKSIARISKQQGDTLLARFKRQ